MAESCCLYAVVDSTLPIVGRQGLGGGPLRNLAVGEIGAVVGALTPGVLEPTRENVLRYENVVEGLLLDFAVLPARFGTVAADEEAARAAVAAHYQQFVANLRQVKGRVELGLKVLWRGDPTDSCGQGPARVAPGRVQLGPGAQYMRQRMQESHAAQAARQHAERIVAEIDRSLASLPTARWTQVAPTTRLLLSAAYLVDGGRVREFRATVTAMKGRHPALSFLLSGPWPPHHFCYATEGDAHVTDFLAGGDSSLHPRLDAARR